ncbi:ATP-binding protein [Collinsella vaginalis]|uniref:ATP-binding protein n=1 Tax=Collinsella vaginalis TaxID=1870987 RepID=UPI000A26DAA5|nr:ATP-binding protein [Collinsella vaginalis]
MTKTCPIALTVCADPRFARLVRMSASNVGLLSSMSVERVEDIRMAAEEAFIYACAVQPSAPVAISFEVDDEHLTMAFTLEASTFPEPDEGDPTAAYADLILASVCDSFEKQEGPAALILTLKADV